jgi:hypothetical protein
VFLGAKEAHSNTPVSQVAPQVGLLALIADCPLYYREIRHYMWIDDGECQVAVFCHAWHFVTMRCQEARWSPGEYLDFNLWQLHDRSPGDFIDYLYLVSFG